MGLITAHSGCDKTRDNSLEFIGYALSSEADCLEADVRSGQDGRLFLSHDGIDEEPVTLEEAFALLAQRPDKKMNCDLKEKGLELPVYRLAERFHVEKQLIYSGETNLAVSEEERQGFKAAKVFLNIENLYPKVYEEAKDDGWFKKLKDALDRAKCLGADAVNMEYHILKQPVLDYTQKRELACSAWTVNDEEEIKRLLRAGIANITTRNLKGALNVKKEMEQG